MKKYWQIIKNTLEDYFVYRINFVMWRVRSVIRLLAVYFLWLAISKNQLSIAGYDQRLLLTYILGTSVIRALVMASRSVDVGGEIANGDLSNYLLKPMSYFHFWFFRDVADKILNLGFVIVEISLIIWLLKPTVFWQNNPFYLISFLIILILGMFLYFTLSFIISMTTFWYVEHGGWPARFLFEVTLDFLAGGLFPLDILPPRAFSFFRFLPSAYLLFFPLQVYLGKINHLAVLNGVLIMVVWLLFLNLVIKFVWQKGVKFYEAYGR